jgi:hypothetical protein
MTTQRVLVVATAGRVVPMESSTRTIEDTPCAVILSHYYRRRIALGELQVVDAPATNDAPHVNAAPRVQSLPETSRDQDEPRVVQAPDQDSTKSSRRAAP